MHIIYLPRVYRVKSLIQLCTHMGIVCYFWLASNKMGEGFVINLLIRINVSDHNSYLPFDFQHLNWGWMEWILLMQMVCGSSF